MTAHSIPPAFSFEELAATWSRASESLSPLNPHLLDRLGTLAPGSTVLDIACGTGEPGLTVVDANPGTRLVGIDTAEAMVDIARQAAGRTADLDARFEVMAAEDLALEDASVDAVVSRMGMLGYPGAAERSAHEAFRVLRPGGLIAIATWDGTSGNPLGMAAVAAHAHVAAGNAFDFGWQDELADGRRERWLREAGFDDLISEPVSWTWHDDDIDGLWERANEIGPLKMAFAALDDAGRASARNRLESAMAGHRRADGSYDVTVSGRVIGARRPG